MSRSVISRRNAWLFRKSGIRGDVVATFLRIMQGSHVRRLQMQDKLRMLEMMVQEISDLFNLVKNLFGL